MSSTLQRKELSSIPTPLIETSTLLLSRDPTTLQLLREQIFFSFCCGLQFGVALFILTYLIFSL